MWNKMGNKQFICLSGRECSLLTDTEKKSLFRTLEGTPGERDNIERWFHTKDETVHETFPIKALRLHQIKYNKKETNSTL